MAAGQNNCLKPLRAIAAGTTHTEVHFPVSRTFNFPFVPSPPLPRGGLELLVQVQCPFFPYDLTLSIIRGSGGPERLGYNLSSIKPQTLAAANLVRFIKLWGALAEALWKLPHFPRHKSWTALAITQIDKLAYSVNFMKNTII